MVRLILTLAVVARLAVDSPAADDSKLPQGVPPLVGTAVATKRAADEWQIRLIVPRVRWQLVGEVIPKSQWPQLKTVVEKDTRTLIFGGPSALAESQVVDLSGKEVARDEVLERLQSEAPVLVSVSGEMVDPYYLQLTKPDTLVIILGPRADAPAPELLPAARGSPHPRGSPKEDK